VSTKTLRRCRKNLCYIQKIDIKFNFTIDSHAK
jgi:hypothetical protein